MRRAAGFVLFLTAACGGSSSSKTPDASPDSSSLPIDAPPDAPGMATGNHSHYVVDRVLVPTTNEQARMYGLDLDGNGTIDNQLGMILGTFSSMGMNVQGSVDHAVDVGDMLMLADVQTTAFDTATDAAFTLYAGQNPQPAPCSSSTDTVCRHHLDGTGTFDVAATPRDPALAGAFVSGTYNGGPGHLPIELTLLAGQPLSIDLLGARAKLMATSTNITSGIIAGGVSITDRDTKIYPALQLAFTADIAADCTLAPGAQQCGCTSGSTGATLLGLLDANHDCVVSVDEVKNNSLIGSLFAPDVTLEGQQALSLGLSFTAVPATFTP